jgi:transcriptional regulator with XRE-family HTH domain
MDATPFFDLDRRIAERLKRLRADCGLSLDELARKTGVSRATLSRVENAEVSATAAVLGRLATAYGLPLSRLLYEAEETFPPCVRRDEQALWTDAAAGYRRRMVSPPAANLSGEVLECVLDAGTTIAYADTPRDGLEHHLVLLDGRLVVTLGDVAHDLAPGDCLRYQLRGPSRFETPAASGARYLLFIV